MGKMPKAVQAKHIPDQVFLEAVERVMILRNRPTATVTDVTWVLSGHEKFVLVQDLPGVTLHADPNHFIPSKLIVAKARKLIRRGLLGGCYCGCRGDFTLTDIEIVGNIVYDRAWPLDLKPGPWRMNG